MTLHVSSRVAGHMHEALMRAYPEEGCGVLLGRDGGGGGEDRGVERAIALDNVQTESRSHRFLISPEQFLAADREARAAGLDVIGFFHSHPDHPARPSAYDLEHAWPYYSYVIVEVRGGSVVEMASWRLREDRSRFDPERIELTRDDAGEPSLSAGEETPG